MAVETPVRPDERVEEPPVAVVSAQPVEVPLSVRVIRGLRWRLERGGRRLILGALAVGGVLWLLSGVYTVANGETAALLRFGALVDASVEPGLHLRLRGIDRVVKARTGEVFRAALGGEPGEELALLTGDENLIEADLVVQYRIKDLPAFLFATEDPRQLLVEAVRAALVRASAATTVDGVLTAEKASVQNTVRAEAQASLDRFGAGVTVVSVNLQAVDPPREASGAFRAVSDARAEAAKAASRAEGERDRALRLARGEADGLLTEARAEAERRLEHARGASERFLALLEQKRLAPGQTRSELYWDTVREVLPPVRLIVLAPGETPRIDVQLLESGKRESGSPIPPGLSFDDR